MEGGANLNDVNEAIRRWKSEVLNFRNDGWTKKAYEDKLLEVMRKVEEAIDEINNH